MLIYDLDAATVHFDKGAADDIEVDDALNITVDGQSYTVPHVVWASASYMAIGPGGVYCQTGTSLHLNDNRVVVSEGATLTDTNVWWYSGRTLNKGTFGLDVVDSYTVPDVDSIGLVKTSTQFWAIGDRCVYGLTFDNAWCGEQRPATWAGGTFSLFLGFANGLVIRLEHGRGVSAYAAGILDGEAVPGSAALHTPAVVIHDAVSIGESLKKIRVDGCGLTLQFESSEKTVNGCIQATPAPSPIDTEGTASHYHRVYLHDNLCPVSVLTMWGAVLVKTVS